MIKELNNYLKVTGEINSVNISYSKKKDLLNVSFAPGLKISDSPDTMITFLEEMLEAAKMVQPEKEPEHDGPINVEDIVEGEDKPEPCYVSESDISDAVTAIAKAGIFSKQMIKDDPTMRRGIKIIQKRVESFDFGKISTELNGMKNEAKVAFVDDLANLAIRNAERKLTDSSR